MRIRIHNTVCHYYFFSSGSRRAEEDKYYERDWGDTEEYRRGEEGYVQDYFFSRGSVFGTAFVSLQLAWESLTYRYLGR
jgi:hypothetical protein